MLHALELDNLLIYRENNRILCLVDVKIHNDIIEDSQVSDLFN